MRCVYNIMDWANIGWGVLILVITFSVTYILYLLMKSTAVKTFTSSHSHLSQMILSTLFLIGFTVAVYEAFGIRMAESLLSGIGLALGLALQPLMKKMVAGFVFDSTISGSAKNKFIKCGDFEGRVTNVGMVHTWIDTREGRVCVHNDYLEKNPLTIIKDSDTEVLEPQLLKLW